MTRHRLRPGAIFEIGLLVFVCVVGRSAVAQRYQVRTYTELDGLPSTDVRGLACDGEGHIWFATRGGVASYDGRTWRRFDERQGLPKRSHAAVAVDDANRVWAASDGPNVYVSVLEGSKWSIVTRLSDEVAGSPWIAPERGADTRSVWLGLASGLFLVKDGVAVKVDDPERSGAVPYGMLTWQGRRLVGTAAGLFELRTETSTPCLVRVTAVPAVSIKGLAPHRDGRRVWLVGKDWIGTYDGSGFSGKLHRFEDEEAKAESHYRVSVVPDASGGVFLGCGSTFHLSKDGGLQRLGSANGLVGEGVGGGIAGDGVVWLCNSRGVSKIVSLRFATYRHGDGLLEDEVTAVLERADGSFLLGHKNGFTVFQGTMRKHRFETGTDSRVLDLAEDRDGNVWMAAHSAGLHRLDRSGALRTFGMRPEWKGRVNSVVRDREGKIWFAVNGGIYRIDGENFRPFPLPEGLEKCGVRRLFLDRGGRIVAATIHKGLFVLDRGRLRRLADNAVLEESDVFAFLDRAESPAWVGTAMGLYEIRGGRLIPVESPGIQRPVYFIVEDKAGRTWFGTDNGVLRWDGRALVHFSRRNGLAGRETNRAAGLLDKRGRLWIGTDGGLSVYRPEFDTGVTRKPELRLLRIDAGGRTRAPLRPLQLAHDESSLTFSYRVTSFADENEIRVRTRLEGLQSTWQPVTRPATWSVSYNYLPPGSYRLHAQAASVDGVWSDPMTSHWIEIRAPFWNQIWFHAVVLLVVGAIGYGAHRFVAGRRYAGRLEREIEARVRELRRTEEEHLATLRSLAECVVTTDLDGKVSLMNAAAERLTGISMDSARGQHLGSVLPMEDGDGEVTARILARILSGENWSSAGPITHRSADARLFRLELSGAPIRDGAETLGAVLAFRDISERLRLEREAGNVEKIRSLGVLAGGIAHDFNNLLTVILAHVTLLRDSRDGDPAKKLDVIDTAIVRARQLTEQLLTFSKGGAPVRDTVRVDELIRESVSFIMSGSNVSCEFDLDEDLWPVEADSGQISQVLSNLVLNAIQAMPGGGVVRVRAQNLSSSDSRGRRVQIEVEDEGCGVEQQDLPYVFDPYYSTKAKGNGLGLSTSYSIVRRHGGTLTVDSQPGSGSVFRFDLPASDQTSTDEAKETTKSKSASYRVLVVDDEEFVRNSVSAVLESLGHVVECVSEGGAAIERYRRGLDEASPFDVLLLDLTIRGGMGGREALERLAEIDPDVRAIVLSGYSNDAVLADCERFGFRASVRKPFLRQELAQALRTALN